MFIIKHWQLNGPQEEQTMLVLVLMGRKKRKKNYSIKEKLEKCLCMLWIMVSRMKENRNRQVGPFKNQKLAKIIANRCISTNYLFHVQKVWHCEHHALLNMHYSIWHKYNDAKRLSNKVPIRSPKSHQESQMTPDTYDFIFCSSSFLACWRCCDQTAVDKTNKSGMTRDAPVQSLGSVLVPKLTLFQSTNNLLACAQSWKMWIFFDD